MQQAPSATCGSQDLSRTDLFLRAVEAALTDCLQERSSQLEAGVALHKASQHVCLAGGAKRVRPTLINKFAHLLGVDSHRMIQSAAAAELMHSASLLHDDVIDEGTLRRGKTAANVLWGNRTAVLAGDHVLCLALGLLKRYPRKVLQEAVAVVDQMTQATAIELDACGQLRDDFTVWHAVAAGKTGALFAWCAAVSAWLLEQESDAAVSCRLSQCGYSLGTAFQMADDLLDLQDSHGLKTPFCDIRNRQPSYPLLWAAQRCARVRQALQQLWACDVITAKESARVGELVLQTGALQHTRTALRAHVQQAIKHLGPLASTPQGKSLVDWLCSFV